jgi:hypothetical protein
MASKAHPNALRRQHHLHSRRPAVDQQLLHVCNCMWPLPVPAKWSTGEMLLQRHTRCV